MEVRNRKSTIKPSFIKLQNDRRSPRNPTPSEKATDLSASPSLFLPLTAIVSILLAFQCAISVNPHSGQGNPPMFGDYEAQRHWMEITYNLPIKNWYVNGTDNDLMYWGLDYPPLTAYHHYILGAIAHKINPKWVELFTSRGHESLAHKLFMRISAILPFFIFYIPPLLLNLIARKNTKNSYEAVVITAGLALFYPGLLVIDNGHFQYNSISLGLFLIMFSFLIRDRLHLGAIFFVLALNYKQMELYHSLPVFFYILSRSIDKSSFLNSILNIARVGIVVLFTFGLIWMPFIMTGSAKDVILRVFPFNRGIYEDKVASFWCAFSFVLKRIEALKNVQIYLSTLLVLLCSAPSLAQLFLRPTDKNFKLSLTATSLSFFLFSFHVHEKTILLAITPSLLLLPHYPDQVLWLLNISNISLFSLCVKDNFAISAASLFFAYYLISSCFKTDRSMSSAWIFLLRIFSILIGFLICGLELWGPSNQRFPHIYQLLNAFYCCIHFIGFLTFFTVQMFRK